MDFYVSAVTGQLLTSTAFPQAATATPSGKLQSTQPIRIQYSAPDPTGAMTSYIPCAAPGSAIKFGLKQKGHYSDTVFDVYTDSFTAPADPTQATSFYTSTLTIDGDALRALFPVASDGTSPDFVALMGEILSGTVPSATFTFTAQNNVIKGDEAPAQAVAGASGYPSAPTVSALVTPFETAAATGAATIPPGTLSVNAAAALTGELNLTLPPAAGYNAGQILTIRAANPNGQVVAVFPHAGDSVNASTSTVVPIGVIGTGAGLYAEARLISDGVSAWKALPALGPLPANLTGLLYSTAGVPTKATAAQAVAALVGGGSAITLPAGTTLLTGGAIPNGGTQDILTAGDINVGGFVTATTGLSVIGPTTGDNGAWQTSGAGDFVVYSLATSGGASINDTFVGCGLGGYVGGENFQLNDDGSGYTASFEWDASGNTYALYFYPTWIVSELGISMFGGNPVTSRPPTPSTLADVINLLQTYGMCD